MQKPSDKIGLGLYVLGNAVIFGAIWHLDSLAVALMFAGFITMVTGGMMLFERWIHS